MTQFAVILTSHLPYHVSAGWGPFGDRDEAIRFAAFVTAEVDPASVITLQSPVAEALNWRDMIRAEKGMVPE